MSAFEYGWTSDTAHSFWFTFKQCNRAPLSWKEELYERARAIAQNAKKPIWVAFSGGMASEIVCRTFFDQGLHFSVVTIQHAKGTNEHEVQYARAWCRKHGINHNVVSLDVDEFISKDIERYIEESYVADHPYRFLQLKLLETIEKLGGYAVLGCGEQQYFVRHDIKSPTKDDVQIAVSVRQIIGMEWRRKNRTHHEPSFFSSTPEMYLAYQQLPIVQCAFDNPEIFKSIANSFGIRRIAYQTAWLDIESRPPYDGFERFESRVKKERAYLQKHFGKDIGIQFVPIRDAQVQLAIRS